MYQHPFDHSAFFIGPGVQNALRAIAEYHIRGIVHDDDFVSCGFRVLMKIL